MPKKTIDEIVDLFISRLNNFNAELSTEKNLLDPFATLASTLENRLSDHLNFTQDQWLLLERQRQKQKNLMNHLGEMQQEIIGSLDGWESFAAGSSMPDVVGIRGKQKIIAEIKNKHNTMNNSAKKATYDDMLSFLSLPKFRGFIGVVVYIVDKKFNNQYWKNFTVGKERPIKDNLLVMSGKVFYAIAADSNKRQPVVDFDSKENLREWTSWDAFDRTMTTLIKKFEEKTGSKVDPWVKRQFEDFFKIYQ